MKSDKTSTTPGGTASLTEPSGASVGMGEARRESVDITAPVSSRSVDKRYNAAIAVMGILTLLVAAVLLISRLAPNSSTLAPQSAQPSDTYSDFSGDSPIEGTEPAPEFGIVVDGDMRVVDLERGSAAELAGIQRGDVILRLEGIPLTLPAQARQTAVDLFSSRPGKDITVTINRGGQSTSVQVIPAPRADKGGSSENPVPTATPVVEPYTYF